MKFIENGSVTSPKGFLASGVRCGIRPTQTKKDLALIFAEVPCTAAAVYTKNLVKGAPLTITKNHISDGYARAVICNSGNANTCNADGEEKAEMTCDALAKALNISANDIIIGSTGVIGQPINVNAIIGGIPELVGNLSENGTPAAEAIMTTDTVKKEYAVEFEIGGKTAHIGAIAKGSGMINPNMATMLSFITTDVKISAEMLNEALHMAVEDTYNMICIDGDTSTNDMVTVMASGYAENTLIDCANDNYTVFRNALFEICRSLARSIASDGEGATKLLECKINGAHDTESARVLAKSVINSSLVKTAMYGADANWGRILCALGYAGVDIDVDKIDVRFISKVGEIKVCENGKGYPFDEDLAKAILLRKHITIAVDLKDGESEAIAWGCDLSYEYVRINGDYRS
ncbi:MAG: bifunctional glutamate N-acetyltransferase/amino-acid acetyltransferase ArgJ, partial [Clostridia bacterium]|nr:bifunctional glutamate N-acetyltransferase/amino-acid acetyltransferase ArgJ [Clostridia bacterium]